MVGVSRSVVEAEVSEGEVELDSEWSRIPGWMFDWLALEEALPVGASGIKSLTSGHKRKEELTTLPCSLLLTKRLSFRNLISN